MSVIATALLVDLFAGSLLLGTTRTHAQAEKAAKCAPEPLIELRRFVRLQRAYNHMNAGDLAVEHKDHEGALREYGAAEKLAPDRLF
ncbi:hypothetical protein BH20ACI3_BH20ACI3_09010 [soil metagenome]